MAAVITAPPGQPIRVAQAELLEWHPTASRMPDADLNVLMWVRYEDGTAEWCSGFWDGDERWWDCTAMPVSGTVTHWALPEGPKPC